LLSRFLLTMDLDPEYGAIVYAMILASPDGDIPYYSSADVLAIAILAWPRGFRDAGPTQIGVRLLEMCGLGLLVRHRMEDRYRLRSNNLIRLFGTRQDVQRRLSELQGKVPVPKLSSEHRRDPLDTTPRRYSPLTRGQERLISPTATGARIIFGTSAVQRALLAETFDARVSPQAQSIQWAFAQTRWAESGKLVDEIIDMLRRCDRDQSL